MPLRQLIALVAALVVTVPAPLVAQAEPVDPGRVQVKRSDLEQQLKRLEDASRSSTFSSPVRERSKAEAAVIRVRLAEGDFQVGDRITLEVEGETALTDSFTVMEGRVLRLVGVGDISLVGVLRSELESHLQTTLSKFLRNPVVRARSLIRMSLLGDVGRPGFYVVPTDMVLTDALMLAGGPGGTAKLDRIRVERRGQVIWTPDALRDPVAKGYTLEQLNLQAGDEVIVPKRGGLFGETTWRTVSLVLSIPVAIYGLIKLF